MDQNYVIRDANLWIQSVNGGLNGAPVWCSFEFYAVRLAKNVAEYWANQLASSWDNLTIETANR